MYNPRKKRENLHETAEAKVKGTINKHVLLPFI